MRVDEPTEDKVKDGMLQNIVIYLLLVYIDIFIILENEDNEQKEEILNIKPTDICSPTIVKPLLTPSQIDECNPFSANNSLDSKFGQKLFLKPSKLGSNALTPLGKNSFTLNPSKLNPFMKTHTEGDSSDCDSDKHKNSSSVSNGETPKFVPLLQAENKNSEIIVKPVTAVLPTTQVW